MISNRCYCGSAQRRQATFEKGTLNGLNYLEVDHPGQTKLTVTFLRDASALKAANFIVDGGTRVTNIQVVSIAHPSPNVVEVTVDRRGDFSAYILRIREGVSLPASFDPVLCDLSFSFKVGCPSDFDCRVTPPNEILAADRDEIDYLAKDYSSFRRLMLDRLSVTMPNWTERSAADLGVTLVEMLASVADELSYYQDSVGTEAFLATARRRTSVRRHVRLLDYDLDEGQAARTFVALTVAAGSPADGYTLPAGTPVLDATDGEGIRVSTQEYARAPIGTFGFEILHSITLRSSRNRFRIHTWSDLDCKLAKGSTGVTFLKSPGLNLQPGDLVLFYEERDPITGSAADADPDHRHVVRLTQVTPLYDPVEKVDVLDVVWDEEDALPFDLVISSRLDEDTLTDLSVANANVAVAEHGLKTAKAELIPPAPLPGERYNPTIFGPAVTQSVEFSAVAAAQTSASATMQATGTAMPNIELTNGDGTWTAVRDLLASGPFDRNFVTETEEGETRLRFGNDQNGNAPRVNVAFASQIRFGSGRAGNIGAGSLSRIVTDIAGIDAVWNPLPGTGGREPETLARARRFAPEAYQIQERCVTPADYARRAEQFAGVQHAYAVFRWTGSWLTVYLAIDRTSGRTVGDDPLFRQRLLNYLDRYRMAGTDLELVDPVSIPLQIKLRVCVSGDHYRAEVLQRLTDAFSAGIRADGQLAFFNPDRFTFGDDVYASQILAAAMAIPGVDHARIDTFKRWSEAPNGELEAGVIPLGENEIAVCASDSDLPENGRIEFVLDGGR